MIRTLLILVIVVLPVTFFGQNYKNRVVIGEDSARQAIKNILSDSAYSLSPDSLLKDKETVTSLAELMLFKTYGKATITSERPYECYLVDGYWYLRGTLPKNFTGDVFEMVMSAKDGRVIKMTHGNK